VTEIRHVETPDGRTLRVEVAGAGGRVVVAHLGTPNGGVLYEPWIEDAAGRDLPLVTYDRPGYGGSSQHAGRRVAGAAEDVRAISRALGFARCAVWGFSGGGPHALACAALLPDLVGAAATIGSLAPTDAPGSTSSTGWSAETARTPTSTAPTGSCGSSAAGPTATSCSR
jgi:pimeloyl-ACP methyl ester carboxylesterase